MVSTFVNDKNDLCYRMCINLILNKECYRSFEDCLLLCQIEVRKIHMTGSYGA